MKEAKVSRWDWISKEDKRKEKRTRHKVKSLSEKEREKNKKINEKSILLFSEYISWVYVCMQENLMNKNIQKYPLLYPIIVLAFNLHMFLNIIFLITVHKDNYFLKYRNVLNKNMYI